MLHNREKTLSPERVSQIETWIFDLDNTLYPASCRLFDQVDRNITRYIMESLSLDWDAAYGIQKTYFREHGTTMRGLMSRHGTDPHEFLEFVHDIDLAPVQPDPRLDDALDRLPGRKVIFTNGSTPHAERIMSKLGVRRHFDAVFDIIESGFEPKPKPTVYEKLIERLDIDPTSAVMLEDIARNLQPAADMGMITVWVRTDNPWGQEESESDFIHHVIDELGPWLDGLTVRPLETAESGGH